MQAFANHSSDQEPGLPGHLRRAGAIAVGLMAVCLLVAACSMPGQPQAKPSSDSGRASALAYSRCMRSHGVPNFPDPDSQGGLKLSAGPGTGIDPASPQFQAADNACKSLMPQGHAGQNPQNKAQALKYSQCMRAHGISDFPDPDANGGLKIDVKPGSDLAPDNPQFQAADKACRQNMPGGPGASTQQGQG